MSYFEHNLKLLEKHLPTLHAWAQMQTDEIPDSAELHELIDGADTEQWFADLEDTEWYCGILFGFGDGSHVEWLTTKYPDRSLYIIEPQPDAFLRACHVRDLAPVIAHEELQILLIHQADTRLIAGRVFSSIREKLLEGRIVTLNWPPYKKRYGEFWTEFHTRISECIKQEATNQSTYKRYAIGWQQNVWTNLPYAITDPGAGSLFQKFLGKPAILVASGPSLEKNIHLLNQAKGRALIVAAGSGIEPLRQHGITPDLVLSFDAGEQNAEPFEDIDDPALPIVYSGVVWPSVVKDWAGPRFVMGVDVYPFETWLYRQIEQDKGEVSSGPSVANVTWDLMMRMGCDPIALVGQDLALTDNRSHIDGVKSATEISIDDPDNLEPGFEYVEGVDGENVLTTTVMLTMLTWFAQRITGWRNAQEAAGDTVQRTYDCTEGGALIEGADPKPLQEFLDEFCTEDFDAAAQIAELHAANIPGSVDDASMDDIQAIMQDGLDQMKRFCLQSVEPLSNLFSMSQNGATGDKILPFAQRLATLDSEMSAHEIHRYFLEPAMRQYSHNYTVLSNKLRSEKDPAMAAEQMVALYGTFFADSQRTITEIEEVING